MALTPRGKFGAYSGILASEAAVCASKILDYTGDDANDRDIDLGDDYDIVLIFEDSNLVSANHLAMAYAVRDVKGCFIQVGSSTSVSHSTGSSSDTYWKGKLTGADANKIRLGGNGASPYGTNASGVDYRVLGLKLS